MPQIQRGRHSYTCHVHQREPGVPFLLMLHGFMGDQRAFEHLVPSLTPFCNPVTIDLLGFGESSKPGAPYRYRAPRQVRELVQVTRKLDIFPLYLHGYSMGGRLALQVAARHPELAEGLLLESTTCGLTGEAEREKRRRKDEQRAREVVNNFEGFLGRWKALPLFEAPGDVDQGLLRRYRKIQQEQQPEAVAASLRGFGAGAMQPMCSGLSEIEAPVTVMAGSADRKYQRSSPRLTRRFRRGRFISAAAGHRIHLDNPGAWVRVARSLLKNRAI